MFWAGPFSYAQILTRKADSLSRRLITNTDNKLKPLLLNEYAYELLNFDPEKTADYSLEALALAEKQNQKKEVCHSHINLGFSYFVRGVYNTSLDHFITAFKLADSIDDQRLKGDGYIGMGLVYLEQANFVEAHKNFKEALISYQLVRYRKGEGHAYNMIGLAHYRNNHYEEAEASFNLCLKISEEINDDALEASILQDIANLLAKKGEFNFAIQYHNEAINIAEELKSNYHKALSYIGIGFCYYNLNRFDLAEIAFENAYRSSEASSLKPFLATATFGLVAITEKKGDYKSAFELYKKYYNLKEFLFNKEIANKVAQLTYTFESEKKNKQIELLNKEKIIQREQLEKDKIERIFLIFVVILIAGMVLLTLNRYRIKDAANHALAYKNDEIAAQRDEIENKSQLLQARNKDITDSIQYALQIQKALLPETEEIKAKFSDAFCLYLPKDIVSGDFYWTAKKDNKTYVAVADCTGHGIPGAFMSILGISSLNEILESNQNFSLSEVVEMLDNAIVKSLKQKKDAAFSSDGMDLAICSWDKDTQVLEFCGLKRPLIYFKNGAFMEIKGAHISIGGISNEQKNFITHTINLDQGDSFYLFTDGYADQFGGMKEKKFMTKSLRNLLSEVNSLPLATQHKILQESFENWKQNHSQTDDVLIMGIKI